MHNSESKTNRLISYSNQKFIKLQSQHNQLSEKINEQFLSSQIQLDILHNQPQRKLISRQSQQYYFNQIKTNANLLQLEQSAKLLIKQSSLSEQANMIIRINQYDTKIDELMDNLVFKQDRLANKTSQKLTGNRVFNFMRTLQRNQNFLKQLKMRKYLQNQIKFLEIKNSKGTYLESQATNDEYIQKQNEHEKRPHLKLLILEKQKQNYSKERRKIDPIVKKMLSFIHKQDRISQKLKKQYSHLLSRMTKLKSQHEGFKHQYLLKK